MGWNARYSLSDTNTDLYVGVHYLGIHSVIRIVKVVRNCLCKQALLLYIGREQGFHSEPEFVYHNNYCGPELVYYLTK